jgi:hypothetical protein
MLRRAIAPQEGGTLPTSWLRSASKISRVGPHAGPSSVGSVPDSLHTLRRGARARGLGKTGASRPPPRLRLPQLSP